MIGKVAMAIDNKLRSEFAPVRLAVEDESCAITVTPVGVKAVDPLPRRDRVGGVRRAEPGGAPAAGLRALKDEFAAGLHALALTTLTPGEDGAKR